MTARIPAAVLALLVLAFALLRADHARAERFIVDGRVLIGPSDIQHWRHARVRHHRRVK